MLEELRIHNFAIIDQLELDFSSGFNVITGETGAGKSIIIDAVELLLGSKADADTVRAGADRAMIEGIFLLERREQEYLLPVLEREDLLDEEGTDTITLSREVRRRGRSVGRINGIAVSMDVLREVGGFLVDIHGQSAHLSLLKPRSHLNLLDRYADLVEIRAGLGTLVDKLADVRGEIKQLVDSDQALKQRAEMLRHEVEEIDTATLQSGEEEDLKAERTRLANSEQLATLATRANLLLNGDESDEQPSIIDQLMEVATTLEKLVSIDGNVSDSRDIAVNISEQAQELAIDLGSYSDEIEFNPGRLNEVEERLELISDLKRRYSAELIADILAYAEKASTELENIDNSDERLDDLQQRETALLKQIGELAASISKARRNAGQILSRGIVRELQDLRMEETQFEVVIKNKETKDGCIVGDKRYAFDANGIDEVEFMMSANPGEPVLPLIKVASGGETARIMLALKRVLIQADETPILIFDEIDQGIGGRVGAVVGEKLWTLASEHQVLVVTHLPQLASFGDKHYHVRKEISNQRTLTEVTVLDKDAQRIDELADMLGAGGESGKQSALGILEGARVRKEELRMG